MFRSSGWLLGRGGPLLGPGETLRAVRVWHYAMSGTEIAYGAALRLPTVAPPPGTLLPSYPPTLLPSYPPTYRLIYLPTLLPVGSYALLPSYR
eukprot:3526731-Rhodomonas_salina.1